MSAGDVVCANARAARPPGAQARGLAPLPPLRHGLGRGGGGGVLQAPPHGARLSQRPAGGGGRRRARREAARLAVLWLGQRVRREEDPRAPVPGLQAPGKGTVIRALI
eukprot:1416911-Pyramimonas_sp.AAC.2